MKKKILCLAMIAIMALGIPMTANAEVFYGEDDWKVTYEKGALNTNFNGKDASEDILTKLLPGDTMHLKIKLENVETKKTDWYMANEVLKSLEDDSVALGGAYTYILSYTDPKGDVKTIYSNERVGGELSEEAKKFVEEGLNQATSTLEDYFYLDRLDKGESAFVQLTVKLDGETQGNIYQKTLAKLQMDFAVEEVSEITHTDVEKIEKQDTVVVQREVVTTPVKTGDAAPIALFSVVALVSGIVLLGIVAKQTRGRKKGEQ